MYDCFGVSNHFGSVGFGHYTAYGKNPTDGVWYEFDDSHVSRVDKSMRRSNIVSSGAYNLFYRRRDNTTMDNIDFDTIAEHPNLELLDALKNKNKK
jgi:ubiquitin carboxyl-terminal hydrolase 4/11/15